MQLNCKNNYNINKTSFGSSFQDGMGLHSHLSQHPELKSEVDAFKKSIQNDKRPFSVSLNYSADENKYALHIFDQFGTIGKKTISGEKVLNQLLSAYLNILKEHDQIIKNPLAHLFKSTR